MTFIFSSCDKDTGDPFPGEKHTQRVVFVYLGADNSLGWAGSQFDQQNIAGMVQAATTKNIGNGKILIFHDSYVEEIPKLLEITAGEKEGVLKVLKEYPEYESESTASMKVFSKAFSDVKKFAPALKYGLIMWSHATGWLPGDTNEWRSRGGIETRSQNEGQTNADFPAIAPTAIYEDNGTFIELNDFAEGLPSGEFDFIIFDMCYMAGVEVAWALRDKTDYMLTSSGEVMGAGLPYVYIIPSLFAPKPKLGQGGVAEIYYRYYNETEWSNEVMRTATTSLWNCAEIDDVFADIVKDIIALGVAKIPDLDVSEIQHYDRYNPRKIHDIMGFLEAIELEGLDSDLLDRFYVKLNKIVEYKAITEKVYNYPKDPEKYGGMTTYIPIRRNTNLNRHYKDIEWYKRVYPVGFIQ